MSFSPLHYSYIVQVFTLHPGQYLHIAKGSMHAFRKMGWIPLPPSDCHFSLRQDILKSNVTPPPGRDVTISIAWDFVWDAKDACDNWREMKHSLEWEEVNRSIQRETIGNLKLNLLYILRERHSLYDFLSDGGMGFIPALKHLHGIVTNFDIQVAQAGLTISYDKVDEPRMKTIKWQPTIVGTKSNYQCCHCQGYAWNFYIPMNMNQDKLLCIECFDHLDEHPQTQAFRIQRKSKFSMCLPMPLEPILHSFCLCRQT